MKTNFLAQWERSKKTFDTAVKAVKLPNPQTAAFIAVMAKPTGFTPILKEVDAAFGKEYRKAVNELLLNFYGKREPISVLLAKIVPHIDDDAFRPMVIDFMTEIKDLEKDIQTQLKQLQDDKAGAAGASDWNLVLLFETDFKKNVEKLEKELKSAPLAPIEKMRGLLKFPVIATKHLDAYSKAAARLKADEALDALKEFIKAAGKLADDCEGAIRKETNADYKKAVQRFVNDLRTLFHGRAEVQLKKLQTHLGT